MIPISPKIKNRREILDAVGWQHDGTPEGIWGEWTTMISWLYKCMGLQAIENYLGLSLCSIRADLAISGVVLRKKGGAAVAKDGTKVEYDGQTFRSIASMARHYGCGVNSTIRHYRAGKLDELFGRNTPAIKTGAAR